MCSFRSFFYIFPFRHRLYIVFWGFCFFYKFPFLFSQKIALTDFCITFIPYDKTRQIPKASYTHRDYEMQAQIPSGTDLPLPMLTCFWDLEQLTWLSNLSHRLLFIICLTSYCAIDSGGLAKSATWTTDDYQIGCYMASHSQVSAHSMVLRNVSKTRRRILSSIVAFIVIWHSLVTSGVSGFEEKMIRHKEERRQKKERSRAFWFNLQHSMSQL